MVVEVEPHSECASGTSPETANHRSDSRIRWRLTDLTALGCYLAGAIFVTVQLWAAPGRWTVSGPGGSDLFVFEWFMSHGARVVTELQNPFFTDRLNAPQGINMMANTSVLGLSIPLAPVTLIFGPFVSVLVALVLCLAGTAAAWYYVLSRHVVSNRLGALVAGAVCGFAPAMISQANGHVNFVAQFLIPFIAWRAMCLGEPGRVIRNGAALALLVIWQAFINQELLLLTAIGCLIFMVVWALAHRAEARARFRRFMGALSVAGLVAVAALAYPLYAQFFGPQAYTTLPIDPASYYSDVYSYLLFSSESLAGDHSIASLYADNRSEENTFFGWPLVVLATTVAVWLWRSVATRAVIAVTVVFASISLGREIVVATLHTGIPGPYRYLSHLPLFELSLPSRYALAVVPMVGILLALAVDRLGQISWRPRQVWRAAIVAALLPILPTPLDAVPTPRVPDFITSGAWRPYVADGGSLVGVPLATSESWSVATLRWSSATRLHVAMPGGYFLGPRSDTDRRALFGSPPRPTSTLLDKVAETGIVPAVDENSRRAAQEDLRYWRATAVVVGGHPHEAALRETVENLLGPGRRVDDVWLWDIHEG